MLSHDNLCVVPVAILPPLLPMVIAGGRVLCLRWPTRSTPDGGVLGALVTALPGRRHEAFTRKTNNHHENPTWANGSASNRTPDTRFGDPFLISLVSPLLPGGQG